MTCARLRVLMLAAALTACASDEPNEVGMTALSPARSVVFGDEEGEGALSNVWGVAVSADGHVYVSEPQFARVVEFKPDGTFSRVVGGRGDGPGEFRIPGGLSWRGDSLAVTDFQHGISLFSPYGPFATRISFNINDGSSAFGVRPIFPMVDGSVAAFAPGGNSEIVGGAVTHETWLKTTRDGAITDTLAILDLEGRLFSVRYQERGRSGLHPLGWAPILAVPPTGTSLVIVERPPATSPGAASFRVIRLGLAGDTLDSAVLTYEPIRLLDEQIDSIALTMAQGWAESINAAVPAVTTAIVDQVEWPAYQPPVTVALAGVDGSVWLRREMLGAPMARWQVLDEDFTTIGQVELPVGFELKVVSRNRVYGVELDEFDVPRIVCYAVER